MKTSTILNSNSSNNLRLTSGISRQENSIRRRNDLKLASSRRDLSFHQSPSPNRRSLSRTASSGILKKTGSRTSYIGVQPVSRYLQGRINVGPSSRIADTHVTVIPNVVQEVQTKSIYDPVVTNVYRTTGTRALSPVRYIEPVTTMKSSITAINPGVSHISYIGNLEPRVTSVRQVHHPGTETLKEVNTKIINE
jgi:hypothetical protein